ncbi:long-chain fatty acid--CoA ligase [Bradyrhizobium manausense]|uniref:long-chain-fatty-acid--CoA ligase n=1 Tax=Bradyrhizobium manausense TaxID=989370 RepID=UPI001BA5EBA3|nr:long-chain fatty acid--CoA ligase [Bradyrhizobium manausense]MBR0687706.1 long-chain fatty acid--CoA ligase [Bradyrhizobium manausense]
MLDKSNANARFPWIAQYPEGVPSSLDAGMPLSMPDLLKRAAAAFPDHVALSFGDKAWTYSEMKTLVAQTARGLQDAGVRSGDRVAVMMPNHPAVPIWFFGALSIGATVVSINALFAPGMVRHMLDDSGAKVLLTLDSPEMVDKVAPLLEMGMLERVVTASVEANELAPAGSDAARPIPGRKKVPLQGLLANDGRFDEPALDPREALAVLQYTGGTTGTPKGAMLTHANLTTNANQIRAWFPSLREGAERFLIPLPFSHITGITVCMTFAVLLGAELMVVPRFAPDDALGLLRQRRPTFFGGVPTIFIALLMTNAMAPADWTSVKAILCGGAPLPPDVLKQFESVSGLKVRQIYGSTELSPAATIMPANLDEPRSSVGLPIPGTIVEIRDTADPGKRMEVGQSGEIVVAGPQVMKGYWKREEETERAMVDGFFRTGDIGRFDERGYLFIVDRLKDMIIAGGYNVYPANVEAAVYSHPAVAETIVIGVPDAYRGETIKAFVVLRGGATLTIDELQAHLKDRLSPIEMPRQLEIRNELPKTAVGKLSRLELRRELGGADQRAGE